MDWFESRYFSGAQGRFTSPDEPFSDWDAKNPQSWNLYSYARNNPLRYTDPTGRKCVQTSNGPADDGAGGGCEAAGVDANGKITPQQITVGVGRDEANLIMLSMIGDAFTAHGVAQFASDAAQATGRLTGATAVAQCLTSGITGSGCNKVDVAMAVIPGGRAERAAVRLTRWGWIGTKKWLAAVRLLKQPGTHELVEGIVPTLEEAAELIKQSGGTIDRIEEGHAVGGVSEHTYPHINYTTSSGSKATVKVESVK